MSLGVVHSDGATIRAHAKAAGGSNAKGAKPNPQKGDLNDFGARHVRCLAARAEAIALRPA